MSWPLGEAKNHFSELVERAITEGPQEVTRHGEPVVVVVRIEDWQRRRPSFKDALRALDLEGIEVERSRDVGRSVSLEKEG